MNRYWILLILISTVVAFVVWPDGRTPKETAREATTAVKEIRHTEGSSGDSAGSQSVNKDAPRLSTDTNVFILDARPRLPDEPANVYHSRLRLAEHWNECRTALGLSKEQERAILQALYDAQQMDSALMTGPGPDMTEDELGFAVEQIHRYQMRKIEHALTDKQSWRWGITVDCALLSIYADRGALRRQQDTPHDLYWDRPFRDRVREMEPGGGNG